MKLQEAGCGTSVVCATHVEPVEKRWQFTAAVTLFCLYCKSSWLVVKYTKKQGQHE
jgi:hypothetical protein